MNRVKIYSDAGFLHTQKIGAYAVHVEYSPITLTLHKDSYYRKTGIFGGKIEGSHQAEILAVFQGLNLVLENIGSQFSKIQIYTDCQGVKIDKLQPILEKLRETYSFSFIVEILWVRANQDNLIGSFCHKECDKLLSPFKSKESKKRQKIKGDSVIRRANSCRGTYRDHFNTI